MIENPQEFWNTRWETGQTGWDIGAPSPAFITYFSDFAQKNAAILIPGCGSGHEAEFLLSNGFTNITVIDIAPKAVAILNEKFKSNPNITILCSDFFQHEGSYDYIVEQTFFCAIDPNLREAYAQQTNELLQPNGKIIAILFDRSFEGKPPYGGSKEEYIQLFTTNFNILSLEPNQLSIPQRMGSELFGVFEKK